MQNQQRVWNFFAHTSIIIGMLFVVFFGIEQLNPSIDFLTNRVSEWVQFVLAVSAVICGLYSAVFLYRKQKHRSELQHRKTVIHNVDTGDSYMEQARDRQTNHS